MFTKHTEEFKIAKTTFHRTEPSWFPLVSDLAPGQSRRIGDGKLASFNGKGYHLFDFRDRESEVWEPQMSLAERLAVRQAARDLELQAASSIELPAPRMYNVRDWPAPDRVWMHKAHLSNQDIKDIGAYWNSQMQRVVLPVTDLFGGKSWIARTQDKALTKYLKPSGSSSNGMFYEAHTMRLDPIAHIVITEDGLSAYRVARDSYADAVALNGVSLNRDAIVKIASQYSDVAVWLDPDKYGRLGARKVSADLAQLGIQVRRIHSQVDPKLVPPDTIKELVQWT
jgi:hypothetical protein